MNIEAKPAIAYGSIYLDTNENVEEVTAKQIDSFKKQGLLTFVFFDVICKPSQITLAIATRAYAFQEMAAELALEDKWIYVAIGFKETDRPARTAMMKYLGDKEK